MNKFLSLGYQVLFFPYLKRTFTMTINIDVESLNDFNGILPSRLGLQNTPTTPSAEG